VRLVVCNACGEPFIVDGARDVERRAAPAWPDGELWRWLSIPLAGAAVIAALVLIQGGDEDPTPFVDAEAPAAAVGGSAGERRGRGGSGGNGNANLVRESSFSLALPPGWERVNPSGGATFAAASPAGDADATLWVERDRELSFSGFEARSVNQLEALAGSARVVERVSAPTPEGTVVRLAANAPPGSAAYEVTLRTSGPYRYYLATTVQPDASDDAVEGAELAHGSFVPAGAEDGEG
jgi:hypothetical protein